MKSAIKISGNRLEMTRIFDAPRDHVFRFWTTAEKLERWSSCKQAIGCHVVMDFRVGGSFTQNMQLLVNGETCEYSMTGTYDEIVEPERIVYQANFGFATTRVTVELFEQGKGTRVVITHEQCPDEFFGQNVSRGTSESFEKLDSLLAAQTEALSR
jgi:uncharacterized protein YndB with AHSA1/START domain